MTCEEVKEAAELLNLSVKLANQQFEFEEMNNLQITNDGKIIVLPEFIPIQIIRKAIVDQFDQKFEQIQARLEELGVANVHRSCED